MKNKNFPRLMEPGYIGKVRLKNHIIKTAQGSSVIEPDTGFAGERAKAYYGNLASGGVSLVIVESCGVEYPLGVHHYPVQFRLHDDALIPSFRELAQVIHQHDCQAFIQLFHSGAWNPTGLLPKRDTQSASAMTPEELPGPGFAIPRAMTLAEVDAHVEMFVRAAERAREAGFDGVEFNGGTCHLLNSFMSRIWNKRDDKYGCQSLENRARFMQEIIRATRQRCGTDFAVTCLINIEEYGHPKATTMEEGVRFAALYQQAGADAIQVRAHSYHHRDGLMHPDRLYYPELPADRPADLDWSNKGKAAIIPLAVAVKKAVTVSVIAACRLDVFLGEKLLREGKIDFVGMTRRILCDPELPRKVMEDRVEDIRPCLGCLHCMDVRLHNKPVMCRVNAHLNRERELKFKTAQIKKRVLIVGGGPAGMEAARVAALRGHDVSLVDNQPKLGGLLPLAALVKDVEIDDITSLIRWFYVQLKKLGVRIEQGQDITPEFFSKLQPDVIIVAGGGKHVIPAITGINNPSVIASGTLHKKLKTYLRFFSPQVLAGITRYYLPLGKSVVIIGGQIQGCEIAEFLVKRGRQVTIVDQVPEDKLGEGMTGDDKYSLFPWFDKKGVKRYLGVKFGKIEGKAMTLTTRDGQSITLQADTFVTALPLDANTDLIQKMTGKAKEVYFIGDANEPKLIADAVASGAIIADSI
jgi:2,4-dienoyl-CoA reductase (NADPH2)